MTESTTAESTSPQVYLRIERLTKKFGLFTALDDVSLDVYEGEFICFLGPSGCGKTTFLRAIAGLDIQTSGRVYQDNADISALPPSERDFGIVFQSYALFPNLTAWKNIAFGLENQKLDKAKIDARVAELLELVGLPDQGPKYPAQLSGGQQQRIALARALAMSPGLLLLDEPLSALDAKVRGHLRHEMKQLQRRLGVTTVMVTHDQEEALTMSDRIGVMNEGKLVQVGNSEDIYESPSELFVASFVGEMNFVPAEVVEPGSVRLAGGEVVRAKTNSNPGSKVTLALRPEKVHLFGDVSEMPADRNAVKGSVVRRTFFGDSLSYEIQLGESGSVDVRVENIPVMRRWEVGDDVIIDFHPEAAMALAQ